MKTNDVTVEKIVFYFSVFLLRITPLDHKYANPTSALSQLKSRIGNFGRISDAAWHKEVCHAEVVRGSVDEARTS